jgi:hypothetical protein
MPLMANFISMQWTHPSIFWALLLLIIPLLIHLFEWRRFRKFSFTNVRLLQEVEESSRKSKNLKKWLLLFSRLLALSCLVLAFVQPFWKRELSPKESAPISIYLDNSFSMQARKGGLSLLEEAGQELMRTLPPQTRVNLLLNDRYLPGISLSQLQPVLLDLQYSSHQLTENEIAASLNTARAETGSGEWLVISDFQNWPAPEALDSLWKQNEVRVNFWQLSPDVAFNSFLDTLEILGSGSDLQGLNIRLKSAPGTQVPVEVRIKNKPYSNTSVRIDSTGNGSLLLQLPNENLYGYVEVSDHSITYDNRLYFSLREPDKIRVLGISDGEEDFLWRMFNFPEFTYEETRWEDFNYGIIGSFDWIVLNELQTVPQNFVDLVRRYRENGGGLLLIPAPGVPPSTYNAILKGTGMELGTWRSAEGKEVSRINYDHPIYRDVFYRRSSRFEFPGVNGYYEWAGSSASIPLGFSDGRPFFVTTDRLAVFTSPLNRRNSDFQSSPLIVPTIQNTISREGLQRPYFGLGQAVDLTAQVALQDDEVVRLSGSETEYIPYQNRYENYTELRLRDIPGEAGIHFLRHESDTLRALAFNPGRKESSLKYAEMKSQDESIRVLPALGNYFDEYREYRMGFAYWKWLLYGALGFLIVEWLIQKFIP